MTDQAANKNATGHTKAGGVTELTPRIVSIFPRDPEAATTGLAWHDGCLYESVSSPTSSAIRRIDLPSGRADYFPAQSEGLAAGITVFEDHLHVRCSRRGRAMVYALPGLDHVHSRNIGAGGHGFAYNGQDIVWSSGEGDLCFHSPDYNPVRSLPVQCRTQAVAGIRELEYGNGKLYASLETGDHIYEISPETGHVERIFDCSDLRRIANPQGSNSVLNGIGYELSHGQLYVTGRHWRYVFALDISGLIVI
jgi:glutaminyl-peptide cyclotransferase